MEPEIGPGIVWAKHRYLFHFIPIKKYTLKGRLDRKYSEINPVFYLPDLSHSDIKKYTLKRNARSDPPTGLQIGAGLSEYRRPPHPTPLFVEKNIRPIRTSVGTRKETGLRDWSLNYSSCQDYWKGSLKEGKMKALLCSTSGSWSSAYTCAATEDGMHPLCHRLLLACLWSAIWESMAVYGTILVDRLSEVKMYWEFVLILVGGHFTCICEHLLHGKDAYLTNQ